MASRLTIATAELFFIVFLAFFAGMAIGIGLITLRWPSQVVYVESERGNALANFVMDVCLQSGLQNCMNIHDRWLPDDVLAKELYRLPEPIGCPPSRE